MADSTKLAEFLKAARVDAGLTQKQVAEVFRYESPQFVSNWERGVSHPPVDSLKRIAGMYKINAENLFELMLEQAVAEMTKRLRRSFKSSK